MQDRHEVVLEANITGFKQKLKEATSISKTAGSKIKKDLDIDMSLFDYNSMTKEIVESDNAIKNLSVNFDKLNKNMVLTKTSLGATSSGLEKISNESKKVEINTNGMEKAWTKGLKSVKKLTIGFLGARTAFGLFRKYMSEYSRENEEFANKMQLTTSIVANTLAPVFEWFANILQYAAIGLARIIELLTGVNILGKATDNAFKGAAKSAKEFNDNLSGLDEISNISEAQGGLSTGIGAQLNALNEFQKKIKEVDEWLEKTGIKEFFEKIKPVVRDVFGWMVDHPLGTLGVLGAFTATKLLLPSLLGVQGGATGLFGVATVLGIIAAVNITEIVDKWKELNEITKTNEKNAENLIDKWKELSEKSPEFIEGLSGEKVQQEFSKWDNLVENSLKNIDEKLKDLEKYKHFPFRTDPNKKRDKELLDIYVEQLMTYVKWQQNSYDQGKLTEAQEEEYAQTLVESRNILNKLVGEGYDYNEELSTMDTNLQNLSKLKPEIEINITGNASTKLKDIVNAVNEIKNSKWVKINLSASGGINNFANGGFVGDGEIFRAREAGPELVGTVSGHTAVMNNNQIVESVSAGVYSAVLSAMGGQNDRPIILNINGRELAQATYGDYQNEGLRRGTNTALRRY